LLWADVLDVPVQYEEVSELVALFGFWLAFACDRHSSSSRHPAPSSTYPGRLHAPAHLSPINKRSTPSPMRHWK